MIAGMCAGTGNLLAVDPTIVRMFAVVATLFSFGTGLVLYLVGWLLVLEE